MNIRRYLDPLGNSRFSEQHNPHVPFYPIVPRGVAFLVIQGLRGRVQVQVFRV